MIKLSDYLHIPTLREIAAERNAAIAARPAKRGYAAAAVTRTNSTWLTSPETANYTLRMGLRILRARARQMSADSPLFKKFLSMSRRNIVGKEGIQLQCRAKIPTGELNRDLNKRVEDAFYDWGHRENCTASGRLDWLAAQRLFVTQLARDGEVLIQKLKTGSYGFSLKFIDVSYLDETFNETRPDGNRVIMSVEIDNDNRPVAYWLTTPSTDINFTRQRERTRTRVPADQIIHAFLVYDDESQVRGVTWFHAALLQGRDLYSYVDGVIKSARMTALSMGFLEKTAEDEVEFTGPDDEDGVPQSVEIDVAPASFTELPVGYKLTQFDPKQPTQNHAEFKKSMEIDLAAALDVPYFSLSGNMEAVNYSSARVGLGEERDMWRELQNFVSTHFCREVFHAWLPAAMLAGKIRLSAKDYKEVANPFWRGRGWRYVDPQKEINATVIGLENKLLTWTDALAENGIDLVEHLETLKSEQELAAEYGVDLTIAPKTAAPQAPAGDEKAPKADPETDPNEEEPADAAEAD